jgi:hypothetical protein
MPTVRAQVIMPSFTNVPADAATNTWHFGIVSGLTDALATDIVADLATFYTSIKLLLSPVLKSPFEVKLFELQDAPPRNPYKPGWGFTLAPLGTAGYAEEVACVLSSHAALPHTARRRGRVYLGPLSVTAVATGSSSAWTSISASAITTIKNAAIALRDSPTAPGWEVYSQADGIGRAVTGGWVDNSPDTQRRRGHDAASRNIW